MQFLLVDRRRSLLLALLLMALLLIAPWFFVGGPVYTDAPLYHKLWDAGHILFFALAGLALALSLQRPTAGQWLAVNLAALAVAIAIEVIQRSVGRDFYWADLLHDMAGFWLGALWRQPPARHIWLMRSAALLLTLPLLWSIVQSARLQWWVYHQFPVIADFESGIELLRTSGDIARQTHTVRHGRQALAIRLHRTRYSGASIERLLGDWRGYHALAMDIFNPDPTPLILTLRVADRDHTLGSNDYHDRFNRQLTINPGWNAIALPLTEIANAPRDRQLNLQQITDLTLFSVDTPAPRTIIWDHIRLE